MVLFVCLNIFVGNSEASKLNSYDLEKVTIGLLHPTIIRELKNHYGGFTQFQNEKIVKIKPKQLPADATYDSSFKATGWAYEITLQLEALRSDSKIEKVTMVLTNEVSNGIYVLKTFDVK